HSPEAPRGPEAPGSYGDAYRAPRRPAPGGPSLGSRRAPPRSTASRGLTAGGPGLLESRGVCRAGAASGVLALPAPDTDGRVRRHRGAPGAPDAVGEPAHGHGRARRRVGRAPAAGGTSVGRAGPAGRRGDPPSARAEGGP